MAAMIPPDSKSALKDLHQEIDLYDRKIAYCQQYESFGSEDERATAVRKLLSKRETMVKAAVGMANRGIEWDPRFLPRSFKKQP